MKILVPVKRVPDPYAKVRLTPDGQIDESEIKWVINPFDEIALEEAVRLRESGLDVETVAVGIGPPSCEEQMRTALAMGADRAILIIDEAPTDPGVISYLLAQIYEAEGKSAIAAAQMRQFLKLNLDRKMSAEAKQYLAKLEEQQATN